MKTYRFTVIVKTTHSRSSAHTAILAAFSSRNPDGCEFSIGPQKSEAVRALEKELRKLMRKLGLTQAADKWRVEREITLCKANISDAKRAAI